ncbi:MAG: hypothetical protein ACRDNG_05555 [Gaiellaceae bacterium]
MRRPEKQMPRLVVTLEPTAREEVVPGEFGVRATVRNPGDEPAPFHTHQARHASLVLELEDEREQPILLPPPPPPDERDLAPPDEIQPGQSVTVEYVGFLEAGLAPGRYRVRFFSPYPVLGGTREDPLASEWIAFSVAKPDIPAGRPVGAPALLYRRARLVRLWHIWRRILDWIHRIVCWILRVFFRRRCDRVLTAEVDEPRTETISNAPAGSEAWNGTYGWQARFHLAVDEANCRAAVTVRVRLSGTITPAQQAAWETAIENVWSNRFKLCCRCCCCRHGYTIVADVQFVSTGEHQVVNVGTSTINMANWGAADTVDVRHEFGHMLGALDEYFTVDGVDYDGARRADGSIMNNPANDPTARHYEVVHAGVQDLLGSTCVTRAVADRC